jgi:hypothetical protein
MLRAGLALLALAVGSASCAPASTELTLDAPGEPFAVVSYAGRSVTLDATGHGTLVVPLLHTRISGFGASPGVVDFADATEQRVVLHVEWRGAAVDASPVCIPFDSEGSPIERAALRLRRALADGACQIVNPTLVQDGVERSGRYVPSDFDDARCGVFAYVH